MGTSKTIHLVVVLLALIVGISNGQDPVPVKPGLSYTFYSSTCPGLDYFVRAHLWQVFQNDITQAAGLLRLHFHDCFVQGCDGSVLLDGSTSGPSEQDAPPNLTLRPESFQIINDIRALVQGLCGQVVSCADITALAARESIFLAGGPFYNIPLGRKDGLNFATINETLANLPPPFFKTTELINSFASKDLDTNDLVALSGGHTIGISHCSSFTDRLYPTQDPTMNQFFANQLKLTCPAPDTDNTVNMDIRTPDLFDNKYYVDLMNRQGLFTSDQDLFIDSRTKDIVTSFAIDQGLFFEKFIIGMLKMGQLDVLTGSQGEVRADCSVRNADNVGLKSTVGVDQRKEKVSQY